MMRINHGFFFSLFFVFLGLGCIATLRRPSAIMGCFFLFAGLVLLWASVALEWSPIGAEDRSDIELTPGQIKLISNGDVPEAELLKVLALQRNKRSPYRRLEMIGRIISLLIACGYVVASAIMAMKSRKLGPIWPAFAAPCYIAALLSWPLELIWFAEAVGRRTGYWMSGGFGSPTYVDRPTPKAIVALAGWFFLIGLPLILYLIWVSQ